jgi:methionine synthase II (cobalamin-independent)
MLWAPWQFEDEALVEAKRDATLLALKEQEDAGIDIVTDGEQTRQHFVPDDEHDKLFERHRWKVVGPNPL